MTSTFNGETITFKASGDRGIIAEPTNWRLSSFRDTTWQNATVYSPAQVGVKEGYSTIRWSPTAALIWSSDLQTDNTVLLRFTAKGP